MAFLVNITAIKTRIAKKIHWSKLEGIKLFDAKTALAARLLSAEVFVLAAEVFAGLVVFALATVFGAVVAFVLTLFE